MAYDGLKTQSFHSDKNPLSPVAFGDSWISNDDERFQLVKLPFSNIKKSRAIIWGNLVVVLEEK